MKTRKRIKRFKENAESSLLTIHKGNKKKAEKVMKKLYPVILELQECPKNRGLKKYKSW
jgi:hypothetical protein